MPNIAKNIEPIIPRIVAIRPVLVQDRYNAMGQNSIIVKTVNKYLLFIFFIHR